MLPVVSPCIYCSVQGSDRVWVEAEHAVALAADVPAAEGHMIVVPREHAGSIHALPIAARKNV